MWSSHRAGWWYIKKLSPRVITASYAYFHRQKCVSNCGVTTFSHIPAVPTGFCRIRSCRRRFFTACRKTEDTRCSSDWAQPQARSSSSLIHERAIPKTDSVTHSFRTSRIHRGSLWTLESWAYFSTSNEWALWTLALCIRLHRRRPDLFSNPWGTCWSCTTSTANSLRQATPCEIKQVSILSENHWVSSVHILWLLMGSNSLPKTWRDIIARFYWSALDAKFSRIDHLLSTFYRKIWADCHAILWMHFRKHAYFCMEIWL